MKRYIRACTYSDSDFIYHGTEDILAALSIISHGIKCGENGEACVTDSLHQAAGYGRIIVKLPAKNLNNLKLVPLNDKRSFNRSDYTEDTDGLIEPVSLEPGKHIYYLWNLEKLQGKWKLVTASEITEALSTTIPDSAEEPEENHEEEQQENHEEEQQEKHEEEQQEKHEEDQTPNTSNDLKPLSQFITDAMNTQEK